MRIVQAWLVAVSSMFLLGMLGCGGKPAASSAPAAPQAPQPPKMERVVAEAGVGVRGQRLEQEHIVDAIAQPAKSLFRAEQRVVFDIQIPHALNLYKALEGNGPKTHEEFMQKIVAANNIVLPELPMGHKYVYDPATEQLMVERPQAAQPAP
jgi:hypothetical protein